MRRALLALALALAAGALDVQPAGAQPSKNRPSWAELPAPQQEILAPLKADWDKLEPDRRQKWVGIAKRYPNMKPEEQVRVQRRMQAWAKLSPDQRRQARESYRKIAKDVPKDKRSDLREQWAEYQALPPAERQSLAPPPRPEPAPKKQKKKKD